MAPCSCPSSLLFHLPCLLLLLQLLPKGSTGVKQHCISSPLLEKFQVIAPLGPILAILGEDITLSCSLYPVMSAENMELRWFRFNFLESVFIYRDRQEHYEELMAQYSGRTLLVGELLKEGKAAVTIHKVQVSDNGLYNCYFRDGDFYKQASLELKVAGVGSAPQVHITGPEEDGVHVVCSASGWFPKPQVQWRDSHGEKLLALSEVQAQDPEGLFMVKATLVVKDSSAGSVTCSILNPVLGQEKAMVMLIPEPFFPRTSPWKLAFLVSLPLLLLMFLGAACYTGREHFTHMQELWKQKLLRQAKEEDRQTKEEALKDRDDLQAMLDQRKAAYLVAWRKAQLYAGSVTLDPHSVSPTTVLLHDKKSLTCNHLDGGVSVLGLEAITSERCYWEVEVRNGDSSEWSLGVCKKDDKMKYFVSPPNRFWVVGRLEEYFSDCSNFPTQHVLGQIPNRVGVFLECGQGDISFYDMTNNSHIFSFSLASLYGNFFPFFMCVSGEVSLVLCPLEDGPQKPSGPINNVPSLEKPVGPSGAWFCSGSGENGAPPGPETPLLPCIHETVSL